MVNYEMHNLKEKFTMSKLRNRGAKRGAFTLIELLVVIVILAILMAVAIPTFLNQRKKAWNSSAQQNITNTYTEMKTQYTDNQYYSSTQITPSAVDEPNLGITNGVAFPTSSTSSTFVTIPVDQGQQVVITAVSKSGALFTLNAVESASTAAGNGFNSTYPAGDVLTAPGVKKVGSGGGFNGTTW
jgi:type IV pilus assembly protein PilA